MMSKMSLVYVLVIFSVLAKCALGANILILGTPPSPSHHIFNRVIAFALAEKGHNVTYVSCDQEKEKHPNLHFILFDGAYDKIEDFNLMAMVGIGKFKSIPVMYEWAEMFCLTHFKSKGLQTLLDYPDDFKFDLIIIDISVGQCMYPLIDKFNRPPVVGITAFLLPLYLANIFGAYIPPSYYPHYSLQVTNYMSFSERLLSTALVIYEDFYRNYVYGSRQNDVMKERFENPRLMHEYEKDFVMLLSNTDYILDYPVILPPNIIPIGGMHVKPPKTLPSDLTKIINNQKHGFIIFSLGTNLQSSTLSQFSKQQVLKAFKLLKQTVFWKYDKDDLVDVPDNVVIRKWIPQNDLLGHKNCKVFMSHAGGLSTQEAIYHGVPMVAVPGIADQHRNAHKIVAKGFGLKLNILNLTEHDVYNTITEVLTNPKYKETIKILKEKYRDQPQTALDRAVFWSEHVIRHKKLEDMNLPARKMYFFQTACLDVFAVIIGGPILAIFVLYKIIRRIFRKKDIPEKVKKH